MLEKGEKKSIKIIFYLILYIIWGMMKWDKVKPKLNLGWKKYSQI